MSTERTNDTLMYDQRVVVACAGQFRSRFEELAIGTARARKFWVSRGSRNAKDCARFREVRAGQCDCGERHERGLRASNCT
jgi:hypothetical protein